MYLFKFCFQYGEEFSRLWRKNDFWGYISREILQEPTTIHTYVKDATYHQSVINRELPARLSLRRLGSHVFVVWISLGYILFKMFSYSGIFYIFFIIMMWLMYVLSKATLKMLRRYWYHFTINNLQFWFLFLCFFYLLFTYFIN